MIYVLMRFPRTASCEFVSFSYDIGLDMRPSYRLDFVTDFYLVHMGSMEMERLITLSGGISADKR